MTEYVVFQFHQENPDAPGVWVEGTRMPARSAHSAVQKAIERSSEQVSGTFAAVPARSWKPMKVTVETKTEVKIG